MTEPNLILGCTSPRLIPFANILCYCSSHWNRNSRTFACYSFFEKWKCQSFQSWLFATPRTVACQTPWNSPGKNIGVDSYSLLQGIFLTEIGLGSPALQTDSLLSAVKRKEVHSLFYKYIFKNSLVLPVPVEWIGHRGRLLRVWEWFLKIPLRQIN